MLPPDKNDILNKKAVSIKRDSADDPARITAKGRGYRAEKILDIAFEHGVKVRQDKDLTEILDAIEVDSPVPLEALSAVSLILEYVYKANQASENMANFDKAAVLVKGEEVEDTTEDILATPFDTSINS